MFINVRTIGVIKILNNKTAIFQNPPILPKIA